MRVRLDSRGRQCPPPPQPAAPAAGSSSTSSSAATVAHPSSSTESAPAAPPDKPDPPEPAPILLLSPSELVPPPLPPQQQLQQTAPPPPPASSKASAAKPSPPLPAEPSHPPPRPPLPQPSRPTAAPPPVPSSSATRAPDDERGSDSGSSVAEAYNSEDEHMSSSGRTPAVGDVPMRSLRERERIFASQLLSRGLRIVDIRADGNCLFRALAYAVWGDEELHVPLRAKVIDYLVQERDYFSQFVAEDFARYVRRKSRDGTHGNHLELQAAAELFGKPIEVYSYGPTPATIIDSWGTPADGSARPPEPVRLSFHRGSHYNAVEPVGAAGGKRASQAKRDADLQWRAAVDACATQDEMERAVLALSLVEASRGESAAGSSASSSASTMPSTVLALIHSGYTEERAKEAYRVAGHGGLAEMVRFLTTDFFNPRSYAPASARQGTRGAGGGPVGSARPSQPGRCTQEPAGSGTDRRPEASTAIRKGAPEAQVAHGEGGASAKPGNSKE